MLEWDERKRQRTIAQRGIDFVDVLAAFDDPARIEAEDQRKDYGERRFVILRPVAGRLFHITYTVRGSRRRIISARQANEREQRAYDQHRARDQGGPNR